MVEDIHFKLNLEETETVKKLLNFPPDLIPTAKDIKNFLLITKTDDFKEKMNRQLYLKICLENWKKLKESGHIFEEAKAIIVGAKELEEPRLDFHNLEGQACSFCHHPHAVTEPRVCTDIHCICGVR